MTDRDPMSVRDLDELQQIATAATRRLPTTSGARPPRPVVVEHPPMDEHRSNALPEPDIGKMSAEAVRTQFETTAEAFHRLGDEVKDRIAKLQVSLNEADGSLKLLAEAYAAIIDKGKLAHMQVEEMNGVNAHIRELHAAVMKKVKG